MPLSADRMYVSNIVHAKVILVQVLMFEETLVANVYNLPNYINRNCHVCRYDTHTDWIDLYIQLF